MARFRSKIQRFPARLMVYPRFQLPLVAMNLAISLVVSLIATFAFYRLNARLAALGHGAQFHPDLQNHEALKYAAAAIIASAIFSSIVSLFLSHRAAGTLLRLKRHLDGVAEGRIDFNDPVRIRAGDYFSDIARAANRALQKFDQDR